MNAKHKTRTTEKGGNVRSVTFGNVTVNIYSRTKTVKGHDYTIYEVADFSHGTRRMRSFTNPEKAVAEAVLMRDSFVIGVSELSQAYLEFTGFAFQ